MHKKSPISFSLLTDWSNLLLAWHKAAKGKRSSYQVAKFEYALADNLLELQSSLINGTYKPQSYTQFYIHEPKKRLISASEFQDRVVHHALCNIMEPIFEYYFIEDSYANRKGKGTHKAIDRLQQFSKKYKYALRLDIVKYFQNIDHELLFQILIKHISDKQIQALIAIILKSGGTIQEKARPKGLPIGNLTSQFWANCYLHPLDCFIKRELRCKAYLRYVDDFTLFSNNKAELWSWKKQIRDKLSSYRLFFHENSAQVTQVKQGIPWLGFVVYPEYRRLKRRKIIYATRRLNYKYAQWKAGRISFTEFDASVQGWLNHAKHADSWGIRRYILRDFTLSQAKKNQITASGDTPSPQPSPSRERE